MPKQPRSRTTDATPAPGRAAPTKAKRIRKDTGPVRPASSPRPEPAAAEPTTAEPTTAEPTTAEMEAVARQAAERAFIEASIARGEAQAAAPSGELPEGATHEIVDTGPDGEPKVKRRRFSAA